MPQSLPAFVEDPGGQRHQRQGVHESREHAGAVIAVGLDFVGRPGLQIDTEPGEQQGQTVGKVVAGVGEQRETRSEEHTSELQSPCNLVCRLLLEKKKKNKKRTTKQHKATARTPTCHVPSSLS